MLELHRDEQQVDAVYPRPEPLGRRRGRHHAAQVVTRPSTRATVVWVQTGPPRGVGTPRSVRLRARPTSVATPCVTLRRAGLEEETDGRTRVPSCRRCGL